MKTKPTKKTEARFKSVIVVQKDRPLQELISLAADRYLKELIMNYQASFTDDGYSKAVRTTETMLLHGKFYEMCRRHTDLDGTLKALRKAQSMSIMTIVDVGQIETMFAVIRETNDAKFEKMEQLAVVMRPGQAWRKELDAVGLGRNADKWLSYWDEIYPEIHALKKESAGKPIVEIFRPAVNEG
jgi:hypothetical protein